MKYGTLKASLNDNDAKYMTSGKIELPESRYSEAEGINPVVFTKYLAENFIFATLKDLEKELLLKCSTCNHENCDDCYDGDYYKPEVKKK